MLHTLAGTHARPQRNPPVNFQRNDTKGSGKKREERWSWPKYAMIHEQDSWYPMTLSLLFPWDRNALLPAFIFTRVRRQKVCTAMLFFNIFSVRISLHRKHILALGGLTEWHNHAKTAQPPPVLMPPKGVALQGKRGDLHVPFVLISASHPFQTL